MLANQGTQHRFNTQKRQLPASRKQGQLVFVPAKVISKRR